MNTSKHIAVCAVDQGSKNVCTLIQEAAEPASYTFHDIPGLELPITKDTIEKLRKSIALVLGLSIDRPEATIALEARKMVPELPIIFVEDFPNTADKFLHKETMQELLRQGGVHVCTIARGDKQRLRTLGFVDKTVGFPDHWTKNAQDMQRGRQDRREGKVLKHTTTGELPVFSNEAIVYLSGMKNPDLELKILKALHSRSHIGDKSLIVGFRAHPGEKRILTELQLIIDNPLKSADEKTTAQKELERIEAVIDERALLLANHPRISILDCPPGETDARYIGAADIVMLSPGASGQYPASALPGGTMLLTARDIVAEQSKRDACLFPDVDQRMHVAPDIGELLAAAENLLDEDSPERSMLAVRQKRAAPRLPTEKNFGKNVLAAIERWTAKKPA